MDANYVDKSKYRQKNAIYSYASYNCHRREYYMKHFIVRWFSIESKIDCSSWKGGTPVNLEWGTLVRCKFYHRKTYMPV